MALTDERLAQLDAMQDKAFDHAIEEMNEANKLGLGDKESRYERAWLTKMCEKSLGVAVRIEQFRALHTRGKDWESRNPGETEKAQVRFLERAQSQLQRIMEGAKP